MSEKVEKFKISDEQTAWLYQYKSLKKGLQAIEKMLPKTATEADFLRTLVQEISQGQKQLMQNLPKNRVKELHNQPDADAEKAQDQRIQY